MEKLTYYFDFMSPYSFFAFHNPLFQEARSLTNLEYRPVVLAKLLKHFEIKGPGEIEPKRNFMLKQCFRMAHKLKMDFTTPLHHPFNPLYALRIASHTCAGELQEKVIATLWQAGWQKGCDMGDPDALVKVLKEAQLPAEELLERSFDRSVKNEINENIKNAISYGAFGVPSFVYKEELFWGNDALEDLVRAIKNEDEWDRKTYENVIEKTKAKI